MVFHFLSSRYRPGAPSTNGGGDPSSRPFAGGPEAREAALRAELDALYAERAAIARAESEERANLARLQDRLDILAGEIDALARRTRDHDLRERGAVMVANVKAWASQQEGVGRNAPREIVRVLKHALGVERLPWAGAAPTATSTRPTVVQRPDPQMIIDAGARARGDRVAPDVVTGAVRKLPSELPAVGSTARQMINIDRRRRGLPPYGDDE